MSDVDGRSRTATDLEGVVEGDTVRDVTRNLMRRLGLTTVFGNPGTTEVPFLTGWPDDFRYVLGLQESVVVGMADGYAQMRREPALVNLHSAGGVGHALGNVFTAHRNRTPLIITAGQQTRRLLPGEPFLGATEAANFPKPYVKYSDEPARAADVPLALLKAHQMATQPPYGPTFVSIPVDDWDAPGEPVRLRPRIPGFAADPDALAEIASALDSCERPAFVVGPAIDHDGVVEDMIALTERTRGAVWAAPMSPRSSFPEDHPRFAGFLQPERRLLAEALVGYDLVVVLGAPAFTYHVYRGEADGELPRLYQVHDDADALARAETGRGVLGTMRQAVPRLAASVHDTGRAATPVAQRPEKPVATIPMSAATVFDAISELLPEGALVVEEAPSHRGDLHEYLPIRARGEGFLTMASGSLGYGIAAAAGAGIGQPRRRVVAVLGDGSTMYSVQALWSAVRESVPITFVVLDNTRYGAVAVLGEAAGGTGLPGVELGGIDFAGLAESLGCPARQVGTPEEFRTAFAADVAEAAPSLLHVRVDPGQRELY